jgi:TP901 family phage tail tape measure protein
VSNRTVSVALKLLLGDYVGAAEKAASSTDKIGDSATRTAAQHKQGMDVIRVGAAGAALVGAEALHKIVGAGMDFEKAMSGVGAVSDASGEQLKQLSDAAIKAGADTAFSATQAAEAEGELAKAGVSTSDILGGALSGALSLAAAGNLDLGNAATIAANAMNIFSLKGSDVGHIADVLASGANKSAADVDQLAQAMSQGGQVAASLGIGLEDTVGALSMFADAGLKGSDAGTSLKTMLQALAAPSATSAAKMKELGLNAFDAQGNFIGLEGLAGQLQQRLSGLTQEQRANALATIFGSDAVRVANVLYKEGAGGVREYASAVNDQGAAAEMAAKQQDNLAGDIEKLSGSIDTALIKSGSGANAMLRGLAQGAAGAVNEFSELPAPLQAGATGLVAVSTGGAAAVAALGTLVPKVRAGRAELASMGSVGEKTNAALGKIGKGVAIGGGVLIGLELLTTGIRALQDQLVDTPKSVNELTASLLKARSWSDITKAVGGDFEDLGVNMLKVTDDSNIGKVNRFFEGMTHIQSKSLREATDQVGGLDQALAGLVQSGNGDEAERQFKLISEAAIAGGASVDDVRKALPLYRDALAGVSNEATLAGEKNKTAAQQIGAAGEKAGAAAAPTKELTDAQKAAAAAAGKLTDEMLGESSASSTLASALDLISGNSSAVVSSQIDLKNKMAEFTGAVHDNGKALTESATASAKHNQAARDNQESILGALEAARQNAEAITKQAEAEGKGAAAVTLGTAAYDKSVTAIRAAAVAAGFNKKAVDDLIASVYKTPKQRGTEYSAPGARQSKADIDAHNTAASKTPKAKATQVSAPGAVDAAGKMNRATQAANGLPEREATNVSAPGATDAASKMSAVTRAANNIPERRSTTVVVTSTGVQRVQREIDSITGHAVSITVGSIRTGVQARAAGGPVKAGQLYRVNESGAEGYFVPPRDGVIVNHREMQTLAAAVPAANRSLRPAGAGPGRGAQVTITVPVTVNPSPGMDERALARRVAAEVDQIIGGQADLLLRSGGRGD